MLVNGLMSWLDKYQYMQCHLFADIPHWATPFALVVQGVRSRLGREILARLLSWSLSQHNKRVATMCLHVAMQFESGSNTYDKLLKT